MSVLCLQTHEFLLTLLHQAQPSLHGKAVAILDPAEATVCALSPEAERCGVQVAMSARQARSFCPELLMRPLEEKHWLPVHHAFLDTLAGWQLPVEETGWGSAYLDLHTVTKSAIEVRPLATELGQQVRKRLEDRFALRIGWDSGKFTARLAATQAKAGTMRLVPAADEVRFLSPLPITLLPLPFDSLQMLGWLGIRTLGDFARLKPHDVYQRFGKAGRLAQEWAKGKDDRPVHNTVRPTTAPSVLDLDPPTELYPVVVESLLDALRPHFVQMNERMEGCRRLALTLCFVDGNKRTSELVFVEPTQHEATLRARLTHSLQSLVWSNEVARVIYTLEVGEVVHQQLTLFQEAEQQRSSLLHLVETLRPRFGSIFYRPLVTDPTHPLIARRSTLVAI